MLAVSLVFGSFLTVLFPSHDQVEDVVITASGGDITCTYAVLTDDNVTEGSREVYAFFDLAGSKTVSNGQTITLQDMQATITT